MATKRVVKAGPGSKAGIDGRKTAARKKTAPKAASGTSRAISKPAKKTPVVAGKASKPNAASKQTAKRGVGGKAPAAKSATKKPVRKAVKASPVPTKRPASKQATSKQATSKQTVAEKASKTALPKKPAEKKVVVKKTVAKTPARTEATARQHKITPKQALANTRKLLEAKRAHDRQPQPWQTLDPEHDHVPQSGFQSPEAAQKAEELHAGESRMQAIQGSIGTQDRHAQGKRDNR